MFVIRRIPALVYHNYRFLAFSEKRLNGFKDYGPMEMVMRRGYLEEANHVTWGKGVIVYRGWDCDDPVRAMNPVPIVVGGKSYHLDV